MDAEADGRIGFAGGRFADAEEARFGGYDLAWRSPQWTRAERQRIADRMASNVVMIERRFWRGARRACLGGGRGARSRGARIRGQRAAVREVMESEIVPVLDSLGLGASHAWRLRERGH